MKIWWDSTDDNSLAVEEVSKMLTWGMDDWFAVHAPDTVSNNVNERNSQAMIKLAVNHCNMLLFVEHEVFIGPACSTKPKTRRRNINQLPRKILRRSFNLIEIARIMLASYIAMS